MSIKKRTIKGHTYWVIDRKFRRADGNTERYRRVAKTQTRAAAEAEERDIIRHWDEHGTLAGLLRGESSKPAAAEAQPTLKKPDVPAWEDAVTHYRAVVLPKLKPSTQNGYEALLGGPGMRPWGGVALASITRAEIVKWDTTLVLRGVGDSTRRNHHIVLRSVLNSVGPIEGEPGLLIDSMPTFPRLPRVGQKEAVAVDPDDVGRLLAEQDDTLNQPVWSARRRKARIAFGLAALAGMRASEIRALRRRDIDLKRGVITIRMARVDGKEASPKSGHEREIPIAPRLLPIIEAACDGKKPDQYVATNHDGKPWSDGGIWAALQRATARLGLSRARVHGLRHFFATAMFGGGTDAVTVQKILGHHSLDVTQRYAHHSLDRAKAAVASVFAAT